MTIARLTGIQFDAAIQPWIGQFATLTVNGNTVAVFKADSVGREEPIYPLIETLGHLGYHLPDGAEVDFTGATTEFPVEPNDAAWVVGNDELRDAVLMLAEMGVTAEAYAAAVELAGTR